MRAAALILALATSASAFMAPRAAVAPRVAPVNMDASSLVTAYRELYEVGGVQVTADVQQFGPIAGLVVFILAANTLYMSMGGSQDEIAEEPIAEYQFGSAVLAGAKAGDAPAQKTNAEWRAECDKSGVTSYHDFGVRM